MTNRVQDPQFIVEKTPILYMRKPAGDTLLIVSRPLDGSHWKVQKYPMSQFTVYEADSVPVMTLPAALIGKDENLASKEEQSLATKALDDATNEFLTILSAEP